jgi:hypothetical protein
MLSIPAKLMGKCLHSLFQEQMAPYNPRISATRLIRYRIVLCIATSKLLEHGFLRIKNCFSKEAAHEDLYTSAPSTHEQSLNPIHRLRSSSNSNGTASISFRSIPISAFSIFFSRPLHSCQKTCRPYNTCCRRAQHLFSQSFEHGHHLQPQLLIFFSASVLAPNASASFCRNMY